jgi:hypothetical protein
MRHVRTELVAYCTWCSVRSRVTSFVSSGVGSMGSPEWSVPCDKPDAPPRVTDAKTGGATLGPIVLSLLFLLVVERILEPLLLPLDKDGPTEDLVCVV